MTDARFRPYDPAWQAELCPPDDPRGYADMVDAYPRFVCLTAVYDPCAGVFLPAELRCNAEFENAAILVREAA
jgi:hypothetical protein